MKTLLVVAALAGFLVATPAQAGKAKPKPSASKTKDADFHRTHTYKSDCSKPTPVAGGQQRRVCNGSWEEKTGGSGGTGNVVMNKGGGV